MKQLEKLQGQFVDLEILNDSHEQILFNLFDDTTFWINMLNPITEANFSDWFKKALRNTNDGGQLTFVVRRKADQKIIGTTRYYKIAEADRRLAIGYTWYAQEARGTTANSESKLLLLTHAFESIEMNRVEFNINAQNSHSRAAVKSLGAVEEGILRLNRIMADGNSRDTAVYSIIKPEWPAIKEKLKDRIIGKAR